MSRPVSRFLDQCPRKARRFQGIERLEARIAPAFSMTLGASATVHVSSSTSGSTTTFTATATGANLDWQDVESAFVAGHSVVITSGTTGTEAGNIVDQTGFQLTSLPANETLTIESGAGTGLVGNISLGAITLAGTNESVIVHAAGSVTTTLLGAGTPLSPLPLASAAIMAGTSVSGGPVVAAHVSVGAGAGIGTAASPFLTAASALVANNSSQNTNAGGIFITNGTASNPLPLTIGFPNDPFQGIQDTTLNTDPITLINFGSININNHTVANEIISAPGSVYVAASGATSDILAGTSLNGFSNSNGALQGVVVSNHDVTVTAGRDLLLGDTSGMNLTANILAGGTVTLNAGRNLTIDDGTAVYGGRFGAVTGAIHANAHGNISMLSTAGVGANLRTDEGPITLTTGPGGNFTADSGSTEFTDVVGGPITLTADTVTFIDPFIFGDQEATVQIEPATPGRQIDLGTDPSPGKLGLSNADLAKVFASDLFIGDLVNTGGITNTAAITAPPGGDTFGIGLETAGAIVESGGSIAALFVSFQASTGVGSAAPMQLSLGSYIAFDNTVSGAVQISGSSFLVVAQSNDLNSSTNAGSTTTLTSAGKIEFYGVVESAGALTATANASGGVGQLITVDLSTTVESTGGPVTFNASGDVTTSAGSTVSAFGALNLNGDVGNPHPGTGATFTLNGALSGSSITATGNVNNDAFNLGSSLLDSGITLNISGGGGTDSLPLTGAGTETVVWTPSVNASYTGSVAITSTVTTVINYSEPLGGNLVPVLSTFKSLALNSATAAHYTLDTAGGGSATLFTDAVVSNVEKILFTGVPTLGVNLGSSELTTDSSSFTVNSLSGESALATLAVTTGAGTDSLNLKLSNPTLPATGGAGFSWVGGGGSDTVNATAGGSFTLSNNGLAYSVGGPVILHLPQSDVEVANLTDTAGGGTFTLNGWTGSGALVDNGGSADTVTATEAGSYTLSTGQVSNSDGLSMTLSKVTRANLTDTGGGNTFTLNGWTSGGSLTDSNGTPDAVAATEAGNYTLTNGNLSNNSGLNMALVNVTTANLTETAGGNSFTVSGWTHGGSLTDTGATADTVIALKNGSFTLSNSNLSSTDGMTLGLTNIGMANLTDLLGGGMFTLNGWTGAGSLEDIGVNADTVAATEAGSYTLTDGQLANSNGLSLTLSNFTIANLTDTGGGNTFTLNGWTGGGSLTDSNGAADAVAATEAGNYTLTNTNLSNDSGLNMALVNVATANLTETAGGNSFIVTNWTHGGSLTDTGVNADTVTASKIGSFTLSNSSLSSIDGMSLGLTNIGTANLTEMGGGHTFTLNGWTGSGSLTDSSVTPDVVTATEAGDYTLTNTNLSNSNGLNMALVNITTANLTETAGGHSFTVSDWGYVGSLTNTGASTDVVIAVKSGGFTLSGISLSSTDGMYLLVTNIGVANLTDTKGGDYITLNGWTGLGSLTDSNTAPDTVIAMEGGVYTLTDTNIATNHGLNMALANITTANLIEVAGGGSFDVSGWTHGGELWDTGAAGDTAIASKSGNFTLSDSILSSADGMNLTLINIGTANLTDTGGGHTFTLNGWTGGGSLTDAGVAGDTLSDSGNESFVLSDGSLSHGGAATIFLTNITTANLTDTGGNHTFTITGWTGAGSLTDSAVAGDTVIDSENLSYILADGSLGRTGLPTLQLTNLTAANLTGLAAADSFTVDGWTHGGALTGAGGNTVLATKDADFTLTDSSLASTDSMSLSLAGIGVANLTSAVNSHTFTVSDWSGGGVLNGAGGSADKVIAVDDADFTVTNTSLARTGKSTLTLTNVELIDLESTGQSHDFNVSGWTNGGILRGNGGGADSVTAANAADFVLSDTALLRTGASPLQLAGIEVANLTDSDVGGSAHSFTVSGWTGQGTMTGVAGRGDQIISSKNANAVLTNTVLYSSDNMDLTLANIPNASLSAGTDMTSHTLDARAFDSGAFASIGTLTLTGGGGNDTLIAGFGTNILHGGNMSDRFVLSGQSVSDTLITSVMGAADAAAQLAHRSPVKVNGAEQRDLIDYGDDLSGTGVTVDLRKEFQNVKTPKAPGATGNLVLQNADGSFGLFSDLIGSQYADKLTGNALSNVIYFGGGKKTTDTLAGGGVPARGEHDFLVGNSHTHFTPPAHGSGEINTLYRKGVPFLEVVPIIVPGLIYDAIVASGDTDDAYIMREANSEGSAAIPDLLLTRGL